MGIYQKLGIRKQAIYAIDLITWIRIYGLKNGLSISRGLSKKNGNGYILQNEVFKNPVKLRDNYSDKAIFRQVFFDLQYDLKDITTIQAKRIIDAGANIGFASLYFNRFYPDAQIVAIEPEANNFALLKENTKNYKTIHCKHAALWGQNEMVSIINPDSLAASFMVDTKSQNGIDGVTVNQILEENNWDAVDIVKIDIEGAEKEVFEGDVKWLEKTKLLIVELHDRYKPGCTKTFFKAIEHYEYEAFFFHENIFIHLNGTR